MKGDHLQFQDRVRFINLKYNTLLKSYYSQLFDPVIKLGKCVNVQENVFL